MLYISFGLRLKIKKKRIMIIVWGWEGVVFYPTDWVYSTKRIMNIKEGCFSFEIRTFCKAKFKGKISLYLNYLNVIKSQIKRIANGHDLVNSWYPMNCFDLLGLTITLIMWSIGHETRRITSPGNPVSLKQELLLRDHSLLQGNFFPHVCTSIPIFEAVSQLLRPPTTHINSWAYHSYGDLVLKCIDSLEFNSKISCYVSALECRLRPSRAKWCSNMGAEPRRNRNLISPICLGENDWLGRWPVSTWMDR